MIFQAVGNKRNPAIAFFHAMGVTGESSRPVAEYLKDRYYCILPTSTVYCAGQKYISKADELRQLEAYLAQQRITEHTFFEFGSIEEHFKYRDAVIKAYPYGHFPVFQNFNHMQYQIKDPKGFAEMLDAIVMKNALPELPFLSE